MHYNIETRVGDFPKYPISQTTALPETHMTTPTVEAGF